VNQLVLVLTGLLAIFATNLAGIEAQEKTDFAYSAIDPAGFTGFWMASHKNFFEQYGISQGKVVYISGSSVITASLLSGEVTVLLAQATAPMAIQARGGDAIIFGATENVLPYYIFLGPGLKTLKDIEGKKASISRIGSGSHTSLLALFKEAGVDAKKVTFVASGDMSNRLAAFSTGAVDLVGLPPPYHLRLQDKGYKIGVNLLDDRVPWAQVVLAARQSWLESNINTAKSILKAVAEGNYYSLTHPDEAKGIWKRYLRATDSRILDESFTYFRKAFVSNLVPDLKGLANVRDFGVTAPDSKGPGMAPEKFVFMKPVDELIHEGFFQKLAAKYNVKVR
jgi:ABC-type nitrate/sulfonate/bicarbonate transport system substrate-binding protein